ncbi:MAG: hypothetical protein ACJ76F_06130 [Bacteroidia bacterium]
MKKNKIAYLLIFLFSATLLCAQKDKNFKKALKEANTLFAMDDFRNALNKYLPLWHKDSLNEKINLNIAICKYKLKEFPDSILPYLVRVDKSRELEAQLYEAKVFHLEHKFDEAVLHYNKYKKFPEVQRELKDGEVDKLIESSKLASQMMSLPRKASIKNLGNVINTKYPEYVPLITPDESVLYFTSRRPGSTGGLTDAWGNYFEDIYISTNKKGAWTEPKNLGAPVNTATHDACVALSADAQQMIIFRTSEDQLSGDLYLTHATIDHWGEPEKLGPEINSEYKDLSACFNLENSMIYFSSDRPGGLGGKDLYRVKRLPNGNWSKPFNLGAPVNTAGDEDAPFLHLDGTLYYSSNGGNTMGGYDIFKTTLDENNNFALPENLGFPVNTVGDDIFFVLSADGKHGYYSSLNENPAEPGYESEDIYFIDMRYGENDIKVRKARTLSINEDKEAPVSAKITVLDSETNRVAGIYNTGSGSGRFIFIVNPYDSYKIITEAKGYETVITHLKALVDEAEDELPELKIVLKKL